MKPAALHLNPKLYTKEVEQEAIRAGFGRGLLEAGQAHRGVVALCADLTESTHMHHFAKAFPDRFFQVGIAEQNLVTVASGMAAMGAMPFTSSYAAFSPGRNWEQIRTTLCLNDRAVVVVGSHAGLFTGPDGATHQILEDIAIMRALPNMRVVVPGDSIEAAKATLALADGRSPSYLRLARDKSTILTTDATPFSLSRAYVYREGSDITLIACGTMTSQALMAAESLSQYGINAEVIHSPVIKPLDVDTIMASIKKTGLVITCEEAQISGGLGSAIAELTAAQYPVPVLRMGVCDEFGQSGTPTELFEHYGITAAHIATAAKDLLKKYKNNLN